MHTEGKHVLKAQNNSVIERESHSVKHATNEVTVACKIAA